MSYLTPPICPVCDTRWDDRVEDTRHGRVSFFHYLVRRLCLKEKGKEPVQLRLMADGIAMQGN